MADIVNFKSLVCDIIFLLLDETSLVKYSPSSSPPAAATRRSVNLIKSNTRGGVQRRSGSQVVPAAPASLAKTPSSHDRWAKLDALLFPYMIYNLKAFSVTASATGRGYHNQKSTHNRLSMLRYFVKSNIESEAACAHATKLLTELAESLVRQETTTSLSLSQAPVDQEWSIKYRRLSKTRLQACCSILFKPSVYSDTESNNCAGLDFVWETIHATTGVPSGGTGTRATTANGNRAGGNAIWKLRKFGFSDADDEEYYWRPWEQTVSDAECDYQLFLDQDYKADLAPLDVTDLDWDSATNSASSMSEPETNTVSSLPTNHGWSIYESLGGLAVNRKSNNNNNNTNNNINSNRLAGQQLSMPPRSYAASSVTTTTTTTAPPPLKTQTQLKKIGKTIGVAPGRPIVKDTHIYNHHNDYGNPEPDYEEDYSYNQAHPIFKHDYFDDSDDDLFGVCHGLPQESKPKTQQQQQQQAGIVGGGAASTGAGVGGGVSNYSTSSYSSDTVNTLNTINAVSAVAAAVASAKTKPHLQQIIGGVDDSEYAYWDQYDDEVEY